MFILFNSLNSLVRLFLISPVEDILFQFSRQRFNVLINAQQQ